MCGQAGSGKTWLGDYLQTRGWHHIDGDIGIHTIDEELKARMAKFT